MSEQDSLKRTNRFPAEWEVQEKTWLVWPQNTDLDWPGKRESVLWSFAEIVRNLLRFQNVCMLVADSDIAQQAKGILTDAGVFKQSPCFDLEILECATDRSWIRDSGASAVIDSCAELRWINWEFNGWAEFEEHKSDRLIAEFMAEQTSCPVITACRPDDAGAFVMEGGCFDSNGDGVFLVTQECLLSSIKERNPGMRKLDYELAFQKYLGCSKLIWLPYGLCGDDTHGHIDNVARFLDQRTVALPKADISDLENFEKMEANARALKTANDEFGLGLEIVEFALPSAVYYRGQRLAASYLNFYLANGAVLVPTFNDPNDRNALSLFSKIYPQREVIGIYCRDLLVGGGTIHCLTQQQPLPLHRTEFTSV